MAQLEFNGVIYETDAQGFLKQSLQWTYELGIFMAEQDGIELTEEHWEVINYVREYYEDYNIAPPMRMIIRIFKKAFGEENANSRYLYTLFPEGPMKQGSKYGGLPKPKNCK